MLGEVQSVRHSLFECAFSAPARALAVRTACGMIGRRGGAGWEGLDASKRFAAILSSREFGGVEAGLWLVARRAACCKWVSGTRVARVATTHSNSGFPDQVRRAALASIPVRGGFPTADSVGIVVT